MTQARNLPRILIVEDEIALAEVVRDYLIAAGMEVDLLAEGIGRANHHDNRQGRRDRPPSGAGAWRG